MWGPSSIPAKMARREHLLLWALVALVSLLVTSQGFPQPFEAEESEDEDEDAAFDYGIQAIYMCFFV